MKNTTRLTVFGDIILDKYCLGRFIKPNPEASGSVFNIHQHKYQLGGAAAVAMLASSLGAEVTLIGVIGVDAEGAEILKLLQRLPIENQIVVTIKKPTTCKTRLVLDGNLQPDRYDIEDTSWIDARLEATLAAIEPSGTLLISDYGKGTCTDTLIHTLVSKGLDRGFTTMVDPANERAWIDYRGAGLIKCNFSEAGSPTNPSDRSVELAQIFNCTVIITLGDEGLVCGFPNGNTFRCPVSRKEAAIDVCGAGDTVMAAIGVAICRGLSIEEACEFSVKCASQQVRSIGIQPIMESRLCDEENSFKRLTA